jgi:DNA-binding protein YbaB
VYGDAAFTNAFLSDNTGAQTYASSNTSVATVHATSGLVTITADGKMSIQKVDMLEEDYDDEAPN